jgi:ketosteroid isomerase-like protein
VVVSARLAGATIGADGRASREETDTSDGAGYCASSMTLADANAVRIVLGDARAHRGGRTLDERLCVRFPWLLPRIVSSVMRLRPGSRVRRTFVERMVYRGWAASDRGDLELTLCFYDRDVEVRWPEDGVAAFPDVKGVYRGHEGFRRIWDALHEPWEVDAHPEEVIDAGDRLLTIGQIAARGKGSGIPTNAPMLALYKFRAGRILSEQWFNTRDEALEAAGLRE